MSDHQREQQRRPVVGVMGSGSRGWNERAAPLGSWLADCGCHLLTGGGGGVMSAVSQAFWETPDRQGLVLAVLPSLRDDSGDAPEGYPNPWVEVAIRTHLPLSGDRGTARESRNHINVLSSDLLVFLPGSAGTRSELQLAVRYRRPTVVWMEDSEPPPPLPEHATRIPVVTAGSLEEVQRFVRDRLEPGRQRSSASLSTIRRNSR